LVARGYFGKNEAKYRRIRKLVGRENEAAPWYRGYHKKILRREQNNG
jgi:hypothetical protein